MIVSRTPLQRAAGLGGCQRSASTGGAAKGMPFQLSTPSTMLPSTLPYSVVATDAAGAAAVELHAGTFCDAPPGAASGPLPPSPLPLAQILYD